LENTTHLYRGRWVDSNCGQELKSYQNQKEKKMADLVRVSATDVDGIPDMSHAVDAPPGITFTLEASAPEWAGGMLYTLSGFVRDVEHGTVAPLEPIDGALGGGDANWPTRNHNYTFALPDAVADIAASHGVVEIFGVVQVGAAVAGRETDLETGFFVWV
jgi:hypothetical protein